MGMLHQLKRRMAAQDSAQPELPDVLQDLHPCNSSHISLTDTAKPGGMSISAH